MESLLEKVNKIFLFFIIYTLVFLIFFRTLNYTLPFVLALLVALLLQKPTKYLIKRFNISNSTASLVTTILFFTIIITIFAFAITSLTTEAIQLAKNTQTYFAKNSSGIYEIFHSFQKYYKNLDSMIVNTIENNLSSFISRFGNLTVIFSGKFVSYLLNILAKIPSIIMIVLFTLLASYFFTKDLSSAKNRMLSIMPKENSDKLAHIFLETKRMLGGYLTSYLLIITLTFIETLIGFLILRINYSLILSIISAIADVLPILGIGAIYIPLAIYCFATHNYFSAIGLLVLYALISIIRQIIEPKIVSSSLGIHPVAALAAMFIGLTANGIAGMFFCMFLVVFYTIFKKVNLL